jgi:hypothetical protein
LVLVDTVSGSVRLTVLLGERLGSVLSDPDIRKLMTGIDAVRLRLTTKGKEEGYRYHFLSGFTNMTLMSHLLVEIFCSYMLCVSGCLSFSSHRSVELCVLINKIVCLSECFPSVFDVIAPS